MGDDPTIQPSSEEDLFASEVGAKAARKLRLQHGRRRGVWFGLGMSGLIGWSVAIPTLLGCILGLWLDRHHPGTRSWTLMLLVAGLFVGCANAWHWIVMEEKAMRDDPEAKDE
jgi:ATP synthase protein I